MTRRSASALLVLLATFTGASAYYACCATAPNERPATVALPHAYPPSELALRAWKVESSQSYGSGFPICRVGRDRWVFVTAGHVVAGVAPGDMPLNLTDYRGRVLVALASVASKDVDCGLILAQGDGSPVECLELAARPATDGEQVWLGSWPEGADFYITSGYAVTTTLHANVSCQAEPGSSGGPVIGVDGKVVGILTRVWRERTPEGFQPPVVPYMAAMQPSVSFLDFVGAGVADLAGRK